MTHCQPEKLGCIYNEDLEEKGVLLNDQIVIESPCPDVCLRICAIGCSFFQGLSLALRSHDQLLSSHWSYPPHPPPPRKKNVTPHTFFLPHPKTFVCRPPLNKLNRKKQKNKFDPSYKVFFLAP